MTAKDAYIAQLKEEVEKACLRINEILDREKLALIKESKLEKKAKSLEANVKELEYLNKKLQEANVSLQELPQKQLKIMERQEAEISRLRVVVDAAIYWAKVFSFEIHPKVGTKFYKADEKDLEDKASDRLFEAVEALKQTEIES